MNIDPNNKHFVYVNSLHRLSGTTSNFTYNINLPPNKRFTKVVVLDALIPKSYYLIDSNDCVFQLQEGGTVVDVTIPAGNYNFLSWQYVIGSVLTSASPNGWSYSCTYANTNTSADTGKFIYSVTGNSSQPSLIMVADSSLFEQLGFDDGSTNVFTSGSLTAANVCKLQVEDSIFINSSLVIGSPNQLGVLQHINVVASPNFSTVTYQCTAPDHFSKPMNTLLSSSVSFSLTDEHNQNIDLNGLPFSMTLMFYNEINIGEMIKGYLKYLINKETSQ
jgi:hypothetical protein